ncbi:MAG: NADH-quinone oxidoreductase subunit N [Bacteroidota bacterium]
MNTIIFLASLGGFAMLAEIFRLRKLIYPVVLLGLPGAAAVAVMDWNGRALSPIFNNMIVFDHFAVMFSVVMIVTLALWMLLAHRGLNESVTVSDHVSLAVFSLTGGVLMVCYANLTMLFLGIEILSIPVYILAGSNKTSLRSNESAFKYFLMGAFATGFLLFGIAMVYGATASFDLMRIAEAVYTSALTSKMLLGTGIIFILVGMAFKISAVPFHFWTPDVYEGAPTAITAFMSTIVKTAAIAAFFRLFAFCFTGEAGTWSTIIWAVAALTLLYGNITAVYQQSVKRMLAYSSISHAGYMLLALLAMADTSQGSILYYTAAYSAGSIGAFAVLMLVAQAKGNEGFDAFNGLGRSNPILAFVMTCSMLSLAGIPPMAGFFAKYYIFSSALDSGYTGIVIIAVIASLVSVYYYLRVIIAMYFRESREGLTIELSLLHQVLMIIVTALIIALGIFPDLIISRL